MIRFFTYGTLRRGECRSSILEQFAAEFIELTSTANEYKLVDVGSFPGLSSGDRAVVGELYYLPEAAFDYLDRIEGHPTFFRRDVVKLCDGSVAVAYMFPHEGYNEIKSGDWLNK